MLVQKNVPLQAFNTFHIAARAQALTRISTESGLLALLADPDWAGLPKRVLGGGSNLVLTGDVQALVLKVEIMGRRLLRATPHAFIVEAGAGENWHDFVAWTLAQGWPGLENLALIPGTVGAAPVQNIGAYGVELQDRFDSLDAVDLHTGEVFSLNAAQCGFAYRDSVFKHPGAVAAGIAQPGSGLKDRALIVRVRLALPRPWQPVLGYADLEQKIRDNGAVQPTPQQVFDWVCEIRRAKLPDPALRGNVGSFFKNPTVSIGHCADLLARHPKLVCYPLPDGRFKLAAGWLIDACGWRGQSLGQAGVYDKQALVLVNRGAADAGDGATGAEVMRLAQAIQRSVSERFGVALEIEPQVL